MKTPYYQKQLWAASPKRTGRYCRYGGILLILTLLLASCASSSRGGGGPYGGFGKAQDRVPFMPQVRTGTLPNGLRYYILKNTMPENRAFLTLAVDAGSLLEADDEQGVAHFVEHLAFEGTARFPNTELVDYLRSLGMRFGPEVNAYTTFDSTVYGIEVPVEAGADGVKRIPGRALAVLDDWSHQVSFNPKDVDDERLVILEEYRLRLGANERVWRQLMPVVLHGSRYAERLPIGKPEIIQNVPAEGLKNFYTAWYRTDNMAVILVGDFDDEVMEKELASHFTAPAPASPLQRDRFELPAPKKGNPVVTIITDSEYPYTRIDLYHKGAPEPHDGTLASYRNGIMDQLIDDILTLRFDDAASKPETPYVNAGLWESRYGRESRFSVLSAIAKPGALRESLRALLREKESALRYAFTQGEIDRAKRSLVSNIQRMVSEKDRQHSNAYISQLTDHFLRNQNAADISWELDAVNALLPGIAAADLAGRFKGYFASGDLTVTLIAPESEKPNLIGEAEIVSLIEQSSRERIDRPKETAQTGKLLDREPQAGSILEEQTDGETGVVRWELSNGARVLLKETANRNNEVVLTALARGGTTAADAADAISASLAAEMQMVSGLGPYSRTELIQKLAGKQASLSFNASHFSRSFEGAATAADLKTLFELLYLSFTQPRIEASAVKAMLDQYRTTLAQRNDNPEAVFFDEIRRTVYGNNPRFRPIEMEDLDRVSPDAALRFLRRSVNPADYTFVLAGNLDFPGLRSLVETYLASIPQGGSWNEWADPGVIRPGKTEKRVYKGKEEKSSVFVGWYLSEPYSESASFAASVLSEYLDIKLDKEIRQKLNGVYAISADAASSLLPPGGELSMTGFFSCDPRRVDELTSAAVNQFTLIAQGNIDPDIFTKAVEARKKSYEESMQRNGYIAQNYAYLTAFYRLPLSRLDQRPALYDRVSRADLQGICRRLLAQGRVTLTLYPEGWK
ncbi:MAG: insulinase family protein [Treponema sp.]|nr:insulinase family protein [Treponema sp.]